MKKIIALSLIGLVGQLTASEFNPSARAGEGQSFARKQTPLPYRSNATGQAATPPAKTDAEKLRELQEQFDAHELTLELVDAHSTGQGGLNRLLRNKLTLEKKHEIEASCALINQKKSPTVIEIENCCAGLLFIHKAAEPAEAALTFDAIKQFINRHGNTLFCYVHKHLNSSNPTVLSQALRCVKMLHLVCTGEDAIQLYRIQAKLNNALSGGQKSTSWNLKFLSPRLIITATVAVLILGYFTFTRNRNEKKK